MIVLEGKSGLRKSQTLEILGGLKDPNGHDWFAAVSSEFGSTKFIEQIQGKILVEIPDMSSFERGLFMKIIGDLSKRVDPYRVPWDKYSSDHPRRGVFGGTSENSNYLSVPEGRRRYWPIFCRDINSDLVRSMREQLFAEAYVAYQSGATWHEMPESTKQEQLDRVDEDVWSQTIQNYLIPDVKYHSSELLVACNVKLENQTDGLKRRINKIMTSLGWEQKVDTVQGRSVKRWRRGT
jgi:putative DNA primase/helicase